MSASFIAVVCLRKSAVSVESVTWIMTPAGRSSSPRIAHTEYDQKTGRGVTPRCSCSSSFSGSPVRNTRSSSAMHPFASPSGTASAKGRPMRSFPSLPTKRANASLR
jgi:hypothetical protein